MPQPNIVLVEWSRVICEVDSEKLTFKDAKVYPSRVEEWDWGNSGTRHNPGVAITDVLDLMDAGCTHIIVTSGMHDKLMSRPLQEAFKNNVCVISQLLYCNTSKVKDLYDDLVSRGYIVGALIHSTC